MKGPSRRGFLTSLPAVAASLATLDSGEASAARNQRDRTVQDLKPRNDQHSFDPWLEIDTTAFKHNVREMSRRAGGRPILAVVKNNAYGLGDTVVGPLLDACPEVTGIACVRAQEALAMRAAGVRKPILNMAEVGEEETAELVAHGVWPTLWLDDAGARMDRLAARLQHPIPVHLCIDTGMGREGMPYQRALSWIEGLASRRSIRIDGTWTMFIQDLDFDREQLSRFLTIVREARRAGYSLGRLHAAPTYEVFYLPEARLDMVRCGQGLFGIYPDEAALARGGLQAVYRLRARVVRVEQLRPGEGAGFFGGRYIAERPTWMALLPVGRTDGYPSAAANSCRVLVQGRLYPVVVVTAAHVILEIGEEKTVDVGDIATLIGPDDPGIDSLVVAHKVNLTRSEIMSRFSARLPKQLV